MANQFKDCPQSASTRSENSVKHNVSYQYRSEILDEEMQRNGNILFERFPIQTRLGEINQQSENTFNNNYYLNNQLLINNHSNGDNIDSIHTRMDNLSLKSDRFYVPNPSSNNITNQTGNNMNIYYPENTRLKSKTPNTGYTPNPGASSMPINNNFNISPDKIVPITTRVINKHKN